MNNEKDILLLGMIFTIMLIVGFINFKISDLKMYLCETTRTPTTLCGTK